jgi:hypothetical protein
MYCQLPIAKGGFIANLEKSFVSLRKRVASFKRKREFVADTLKAKSSENG